jgi:hypothetical protein
MDVLTERVLGMVSIDTADLRRRTAIGLPRMHVGSRGRAAFAHVARPAAVGTIREHARRRRCSRALLIDLDGDLDGPQITHR